MHRPPIQYPAPRIAHLVMVPPIMDIMSVAKVMSNDPLNSKQAALFYFFQDVRTMILLD